MAMSTSEKPMPPPPHSVNPHSTAQHPVGPRRAPEKSSRQHTVDTLAKTVSGDRSYTTRSQTLPANSRTTSHLGQLVVSQEDMRPGKISASQPVASHLRRGSLSDTASLAPVDLKRLLSKPAKHTPSSASAISLPSDSEVSATSRGPANLPQLSLSTTSRQSSHDRESLQRGLSAANAHSALCSTTRPGSRDTSSSRNAEVEQAPRQRNVLRRRPSRPSTTASAADPPTSSLAPQSLSTKHRMRSIGALHEAVVGSPAKVSDTQGKDSWTSRGLTPAGQVALAYKQQEKRRSELAEKSGWVDSAEALTMTTSVSVPTSSSLLNEVEDDEAAVPYYTVFGSSSGHVVTAGSSLDFTHQLDGYLVGEGYNKKQSRSLSRKVSGRFRKVADIVKRERDVSDNHSRVDGWRPFDGHSYLTRSPVRMSTDVDTATQGSSHRSILTAKVSPHEKDRSIAEDASEDGSPYGSRLGKVRDKEHEEGGKFWRLVKRISTGGLRDKYRQSREATPPPVPPLPMLLQKQVDTDVRRASEAHCPPAPGPNQGGAMLRFMQSRASLSSPRPPMSSSHKMSPRHTSASRPFTGGKASSTPSAHRPSTTTRSSSPVSSDIASSGFFHRTHSTRSSTSSYGEAIPPMPSAPKSTIAQYIMPPSELRQFDTDFAAVDVPVRKARKPSRSHSEPVDHAHMPSSPDECRPLPLPPRRHRDRSAHEQSPSPTLPSFSTEGIINNFSSPSLPLPEFGQAPARPKRSVRRKPASIELPPASAASTVALNSPTTPRTPRPHPQIVVEGQPQLSSTSTVHRTATPRRNATLPTTPSAVSPASTASSQKSPLTFRELESPRSAWTEQEKADKWEALLERSARAGGTLHIGESGLLSEQLHLSEFPDF